MTGSGNLDVATRSLGVRDPFLDSLRTWAILRVVAVHMLAMAPVALLFWPAPTFVMPGMPLVFFVSGALALRSLSPPDHGTMRARRTMSTSVFWRDRFRRLLIPFWVYVTVATAVAFVLDFTHSEDAFTVSHVRAALSFVPLLNPINSPVGYDGVVHLWFLVVIAWLLLLAPVLVRLHRRFPHALITASLLVAVLVPLYDLRTEKPVFAEINAIALFQFFFILGFWYTDAQLVRLTGDPTDEPRRWFDGAGAFAVALAAFVGAWLVWRFQEPEFVNASPWVHGLLGIGWLSLVLRARAWVVKLAVILAVPLAFLNRRALTIYLYGWPTTALASKGIGAMGWQGWPAAAAFFAAAVGMLVLAVVVFGPVEDFAAGRRRPGHNRGGDGEPSADQPTSVVSRLTRGIMAPAHVRALP